MPKVSATAIRDWLAEREDEMLALLERIVRINSYTGNKDGVDAVGAVVGGVMSAMGFAVELHPRDKVGDHLLCLSPAAAAMRGGGGRVLLCGHMDTVFPDDGSFDCFERVEHEDGPRIIGPGVVDMKGGLVAGIYALQALDAHGLLADMPVAFVFNSDEETGSRFSKDLIEDQAERSCLAMVFECASLAGQACTGRKGKRTFKLRVSGRAGHAGNLDEPKASAVLELAHLTIALEALNDPERGVSVNAGLVSGGVGPNTIAPHAEATVECRYPLTSDGEALEAAVKKLAASPTIPGTSVEVEVVPGRPPMEQTDANRALLDVVRRTGEELGITVSDGYRGGVSDANFIAHAGCPVIDGMGPVGARDHSPDEFMVAASLVERAALSAVSLRRAWSERQGENQS